MTIQDHDGDHYLMHPMGISPFDIGCIAQSSSQTPFLWIGRDHRLGHDEVVELVGYLNRWLATGKLDIHSTDTCTFAPIVSPPLARTKNATS